LLTELDKVLFYMGRREVPLESSFEKVPSEVKENFSWNTISNMPGIPCTWSPYYQIRGDVYHKSGRMRAILSSCCI